jgi:hypothetical protein
MRSKVAVGSALLVIALGACGEEDGGTAAEASPSPSPPPAVPVLERAYKACDAMQDPTGTLRLVDEGRSITVDTGSKYGDIAALMCVLGELDTSQAVVAHMESTTAMMGVQDAEEGGITYKWSYHPDNGINMVITDTSERP